jgi:hypothetical protein
MVDQDVKRRKQAISSAQRRKQAPTPPEIEPHLPRLDEHKGANTTKTITRQEFFFFFSSHHVHHQLNQQNYIPVPVQDEQAVNHSWMMRDDNEYNQALGVPACGGVGCALLSPR